jgi:hypothetical protein
MMLSVIPHKDVYLFNSDVTLVKNPTCLNKTNMAEGLDSFLKYAHIIVRQGITRSTGRNSSPRAVLTRVKAVTSQGSKLRGAREPVAPKNHVGLPNCLNREPGWLLKIILNFYPWYMHPALSMYSVHAPSSIHVQCACT